LQIDLVTNLNKKNINFLGLCEFLILSKMQLFIIIWTFFISTTKF